MCVVASTPRKYFTFIIIASNGSARLRLKGCWPDKQDKTVFHVYFAYISFSLADNSERCKGSLPPVASGYFIIKIGARDDQ